MRAVVFHAVGDIRVDDVPEPEIREPTDAIVRLTASAICGTDLHFVRGSMSGMTPGTILGHEGVGVVERVGDDVRNLVVGDRVVICSTIGCGSCNYCRAGYYAQCQNANPNGPDAGTCFFGGPEATGPIDGLQAERARVPYAHVTCVKLPDEVADDDALLLSDIFPTAWFGARLADVQTGDTVAVLGSGVVGMFAILSAQLQGAGRVLAVDQIASRLEQARRLGAEVVDFSREDPVDTLKRLTGGAGPDRVIDAVGIDAESPGDQRDPGYDSEVQEVAPDQPGDDSPFRRPGDAPSQALRWAVEAVAKAGTIGIIGVYPPAAEHFPIGMAMNRNLTIQMGNCNHRRYVPELVELVRSGAVTPSNVISQIDDLTGAVDAYETFDRRAEGWHKVALDPASVS
ncbi:MAG: glutathione-dependent formaldehyde dehydrogenase [Solirubrobacterales bacterium]|nr:glutathione-dependent formaldehyde dehydrogenase [Solirubrobacterales bacterium]